MKYFLTAVLFCLFTISAFAASPSMPEKSAVPLVRGQAGDVYPYAKTFSFQSLEFRPGDEGASLKLPLPKNITAYIIVPPGRSKDGAPGFDVTPYLSMPTAQNAPALPDDLGYGFDFESLSIYANAEDGAFYGIPLFVAFDLDQGKTLAEIDKNKHLRKYCLPSLASFNPHMCAYLNNVPPAEHTNRKYGVVSPIRSDGMADLMTMMPTIPVGFDNLVVAEMGTFGTYIPVRLSKEMVEPIVKAYRGDVTGIPYIEGVAHTLSFGGIDMAKVEDLKKTDWLLARSLSSWFKAVQLLPDDKDVAKGFHDGVMAMGAANYGYRMQSALGMVLRLEAAKTPGAAELHQELVKQDFDLFKDNVDGFTDKYQPDSFNMLDALLTGAKGTPLQGDIEKYADGYLAALPNNPDAESPSAFRRGAEAAHELGSPIENTLSATAAQNLKKQVDAATSVADLQNALDALRAAGPDSAEAKAIEDKIIKVATQDLHAAEDNLRSGKLDESVLEKIPAALMVSYSEGEDPDKLPLVGGGTKKKDGDKDVHFGGGGDGGGGRKKGGGASGDGSGSGDGNGGGSDGGGNGGKSSGGGNDGNGGGGGSDDGGGGADGGGGGKALPCMEFDVERKNLHNFGDQTHWMRILEKLKAANFTMDCGKDEPSPPPPPPDKKPPPDRDPPPPKDKKCDELQALPDDEKSKLIDMLLGTAQQRFDAAVEGYQQIENAMDSDRSELQSYRDLASQAEQDAADAETPAAAAEKRDLAQKWTDRANKFEKFMNDRYEKQIKCLDGLKKEAEDLLNKVKELAESKDDDINKSICEANKLGKQLEDMGSHTCPLIPRPPGLEPLP